jgi:imidazoleglycerol phosphate dehydratase HisB
MRRAVVERNTKETQIRLAIDLDGTGVRKIATPVPFLDHMLDTIGRHGVFDLEVAAKGDVEVDAHHTVEDVGICLGQAVKQALGDRQGIARYGHAVVPMDETLATAALDFGGRTAFVYLADMLKGRWNRRLRRRAGPRVLRRLRRRRAVQPAPRVPLRRERPPHRRGDVQGLRPRHPHGGGRRSARGRRPLDQGDPHGMSATPRLAVVDTGSGNLRSVEKALATAGAQATITSDPEVIARADKIVVPGQGAFGGCVAGLERSGGALKQAVSEAIARGTPYLGICLGCRSSSRAARRIRAAAAWGCSPARWCASGSSRP